MNRELQRLFEKISDCLPGSAWHVRREEDRNGRMVLSFFNERDVLRATVELEIFPARVGSGALGGVEDEELVKIHDEDGNDIFMSNVPSAVIAVATR